MILPLRRQKCRACKRAKACQSLGEEALVEILGFELAERSRGLHKLVLGTQVVVVGVPSGCALDRIPASEAFPKDFAFSMTLGANHVVLEKELVREYASPVEGDAVPTRRGEHGWTTATRPGPDAHEI